MASTRDRLQAYIERMMKRWERDEALEVPGVVHEADNPRYIADGYYGEIGRDDRPQWLIDTWDDDGGVDAWRRLW